MSNISEFIRGHTETIILCSLLDKDSYGYEINKMVKKKSNDTFEFKEATLYTAFKRLEEQEYITAYWGDSEGGARRRYYKITNLGKEKYYENKENWERAKKLINALVEENSYEKKN